MNYTIDSIPSLRHIMQAQNQLTDEELDDVYMLGYAITLLPKLWIESQVKEWSKIYKEKDAKVIDIEIRLFGVVNHEAPKTYHWLSTLNSTPKRY